MVIVCTCVSNGYNVEAFEEGRLLWATFVSSKEKLNALLKINPTATIEMR